MAREAVQASRAEKILDFRDLKTTIFLKEYIIQGLLLKSTHVSYMACVM